MVEYSQQWWGPILVPLYKKKMKTDCSNYHRRPLLLTSWRYNETAYQLLIDFKKFITQLGGKYCTIFSMSFGHP
jgi:hypothetical protein